MILRPLANRPQLSLAGLQAFESVARHMSFARAAAELEITPTAISKAVKHLESHSGSGCSTARPGASG